MPPPERAVRILFAIQTRWDDTAGVSQVLMELIEQFRSRGHHCEKFSQEDAFRRPLGSIRGPFTLAMFQRRLLAYIREHGHRFDVIHAEHHLLPFARSKYRFSGRLVIKSQGLIHFYRKYLRALPDGSKGTLRARLLRNLSWWTYGGVSAADRGFLAADQIHLMNTDELAFVRDDLGHGDKCILVPNGLAESQRAALAAASTSERRMESDTVAFVGIWSLRKGCAEFPAIIRAVRSRRPSTRFRMIGTFYDRAKVVENMAPEDRDAIEVVPHFQREELPGLLADVRAGIFPSFVEGFGLGLLEMLAAGIPTVAWDAPGPRDMIETIPDLDMVPAGNEPETANALLELLECDRQRYVELSQSCVRTGQLFNWPRVAQIIENATLTPELARSPEHSTTTA